MINSILACRSVPQTSPVDRDGRFVYKCKHVGTGRQMTRARRIRAASGTGSLAPALSTLILALMLIPALAAAAAEGRAAKDSARLDSMQIEIWPEYDRPAALVILRGEFAGGVGLPAAVSLRIPASSGGPAAVAYATAEKGQLFNLKHDRSDANDFITLRFTVPARFFHVEFYETIPTGTSERNYRYLWPGDMPIDRLSVVVQEPAAASGFSVEPDLGGGSAESDGMRYRSAQLGAFEPGKQLPIEIRYTKTDSRTSAEILKLSLPLPPPQTTTAPGKGDSSWLFVAFGAAALVVAASGAAYFWWRRHPRPSVDRAGGGRFCTKCGNRVAAGDRFCSKCGAALA